MEIVESKTRSQSARLNILLKVLVDGLLSVIKLWMVCLPILILRHQGRSRVNSTW